MSAIGKHTPRNYRESATVKCWYKKAAIKGARFADVNAIIDRVTTVLRSIPQEALLIVSGSCTNVIKRVLLADGDYFEGQ